MYKEKRILVVIPAHNEERHLRDVLAGIPIYVDSVIVVDDCSTDSTTQVIESVKDDRLIGLKTERNQGVGGATILGYLKAKEMECDIVVKMDGDGQMPPEFLPQLLDKLGDGYDYAKGNRFLA